MCRVMIVIGLVAGLGFGQGALSLVAEPNPAPVGSTVALAITESAGIGLTFPSSCYVDQVRAVHGRGPVVWQASACADIITPLGPHETLNTLWTPVDQSGAALPGGIYALRVSWIGNDGIQTSWYAVAIENGDDMPTLQATNPATLGSSIALTLDAPIAPDAPYFVAASLGTQAGFAVSGGWVNLDLDPLFALSFPIPHPAVFSNFHGTLDDAGHASGIAMHLPNVPSLAHLGITLQAVVPDPRIDVDPPFLLSSNPVALTIQN